MNLILKIETALSREHILLADLYLFLNAKQTCNFFLNAKQNCNFFTGTVFIGLQRLPQVFFLFLKRLPVECCPPQCWQYRRMQKVWSLCGSAWGHGIDGPAATTTTVT